MEEGEEEDEESDRDLADSGLSGNIKKRSRQEFEAANPKSAAFSAGWRERDRQVSNANHNRFYINSMNNNQRVTVS